MFKFLKSFFFRAKPEVGKVYKRKRKEGEYTVIIRIDGRFIYYRIWYDKSRWLGKEVYEWYEFGCDLFPSWSDLYSECSIHNVPFNILSNEEFREISTY